MNNPNTNKNLCIGFVFDSPDPICLDLFFQKFCFGQVWLFHYCLPHVADKIGKPMAFWNQHSDKWTLSNDWTQLASWEEVLKFFDPNVREDFEMDFLLSKSSLRLQ